MVGMARTLRAALRALKPETTEAGSATNDPERRSDLLARQKREENAYRSAPTRMERIFKHFWTHLEKAGIGSGHVVEIGGRANPMRARFDPARFRYTALDIAQTDEHTVVADITDCPEIPDGFCDVVVSVDVFEHIDRPWLAAAEIARILKPGGIAYTSTLFSWRYHPCPIDYWRFTPDCLSFLFSDLERVEAGFDVTERRRNIIGRGGNRVAPDSFGGWRENWRVFHVGRKPA